MLTAVNSTDYTMRLKPTRSDLAEARYGDPDDGHIGNRIDQLGLAEKAVQQYGRSGSDYQILVQLPAWTIRLA